MKRKRVLVVDDSSFMRSVITRFLKEDVRFEVIDTAKDGIEAVEKACKLKPDVMTMDIEMPRKNGLDALKEIMDKCPTRVVMISSLTEAGAQATMKALEWGAVDFLPKAMEDKGRSIFRQGNLLRDKIYEAAMATNFENAKPAVSTPSPIDKKEGVPPVVPMRQLQPNSFLRFKKAKIALIGVSTGGPKALHNIMPAFPDKLRVPVVIVQHMPPNFTAAMAKRLNEICPLTVQEAADGMHLEPNHVYIAPGGMQCRVRKGATGLVFGVEPDETNSLYKPSVEVTSETIHNVLGGHALAIMMTGMGDDGINGFTKLKESGAYIIAQNQDTCVVYGMPKAIVEKGLANEVLPLEKIPESLERLLA